MINPFKKDKNSNVNFDESFQQCQDCKEFFMTTIKNEGADGDGIARCLPCTARGISYEEYQQILNHYHRDTIYVMSTRAIDLHPEFVKQQTFVNKKVKEMLVGILERRQSPI